MLFLASLVVAIAMESSGFHKRIALRALLLLGDNLRTLFAGFMFTTAFLGVWIINTAATAMILPIADVVIQEVMPTTSPTYRLDNGGDVGQKKKEEEEEDGEVGEVGDHHQFHQEELSSTVVGVTTGFSPEDPRLPPRGNSLVDSRRLSPEEHLELLAQQQLINRSGSNSQNSPELECKSRKGSSCNFWLKTPFLPFLPDSQISHPTEGNSPASRPAAVHPPTAVHCDRFCGDHWRHDHPYLQRAESGLSVCP